MGDYSNDLKRNNHNNDFKRNNNNDFKCNNNKRKNNNWHPVWGKIGPNDPTLTPQLMKLFKPPTLEYKPPPEKRKCSSYTGMAQFVANFAGPSDPEYAPPVQKDETPAQRRARVHQLRLEEGAKKAAEELEKYDPHNDPNISGDPYKTLFVTGLNYDTTEGQIKSEFEAYGQIKQVRLVTDTESNKSRGYAFIEYVHTRDMKAAYKYADGMKLDSKRVVVDVERGRTVPGWRPRRLGGGIGKTRLGGVEINHRNSGRDGYTSCEGGNYRERELEKSRDRPRDRDSRDDRHYRDRNRDRCRDRDSRDDRDRDRGRDRTRDRDNVRVYEDGDHGQVRDRPREKERDRQVAYNYNQDRDKYDHDRYEHPDLDHDRYDPMEEDICP